MHLITTDQGDLIPGSSTAVEVLADGTVAEDLTWISPGCLVSVFASEQVVRFMPFVAGNGMLEIVDEGEPIAFDRPITALIFAAYAIAALSIGAVATSRTDP